jgi:hypothetical protein
MTEINLLLSQEISRFFSLLLLYFRGYTIQINLE